MPTTEEKDPAASAASDARAAGGESSSANGNGNGNGNDDDDDDDDAAELEARAIAQAMQSADAAYVPSPSVLASDDPAPLLSQVDGPSLVDFKSVPSVYQGKSVPVALRSRFDVPIHVGAGGSVVEYRISTEAYDIAFGVTAEREEGVTSVKETTRVDSHLEPVTGKFLVGSVPCALVFSFDNEYSWFREKKVTYRIVVTPPRTENVVKGRRLRAKKALEVLEADGRELEGRHAAARTRRAEAKAEVERLEGELARWKKALDDVAAEEEWVGKRRIVRAEQVRMLNERLECGWEDERYEI